MADIKIGNIIGKQGKGIDEMPPVYYDTLITDKETLTNQWRDGKPVYQMFVNLGAPPTVTGTTNADRFVDIVIPNVENVVNAEFSITASNNAVCKLPHVDSTGKRVQVLFIPSTNGITASIGSNASEFNGRPIAGVIEYTKTTDVAIPPYQLPVPCFDIEEYGVEYRTMKIRNGKPVYKMWTSFGNIPAVSGTTDKNGIISLPIPNVEEIIFSEARFLHSSGLTIKLPIITSSGNRVQYFFEIKAATVDVLVNANTSSYNNLPVTGIIEYTKTIDTPETPSLMPAIVNEQGDRTDVTMSQKAITDAINFSWINSNWVSGVFLDRSLVANTGAVITPTRISGNSDMIDGVKFVAPENGIYMLHVGTARLVASAMQTTLIQKNVDNYTTTAFTVSLNATSNSAPAPSTTAIVSLDKNEYLSVVLASPLAQSSISTGTYPMSFYFTKIR